MKDFILPDIGEGIVECELLKWLVNEGDVIVEDQAIAEVMTDKATVEIPAMHNGTVAKLYYKEGEICKVHAPLFAMHREEDALLANEVDSPVVTNVESNENLQTTSVTSDSSKAIEAFVLPDIGEGIVECEIMQWHVSEGDTVEEDQVVVEVMTDKAVVEIPAKYQGQIVKLHYQKGDIAKVHTPLFDQLIGNQLGNASKVQSNTPEDVSAPTAGNAEQQVLASNSKTSAIAANNGKAQGENFAAPVEVNRAIASPAVRRLAREHGISLTGISASGKKGRVLKQDILNSIGSSAALPSSSAVSNQNNAPTSTQSNINVPNNDRVEAIKGIRAAMARQMTASVSTIPHFTVSDELCMDNLIALRKRLKPEFERINVKLSFMPFFIKALSLALQEFPIINSRLNADATELTYLSSHNIGLAVDSKIGLLVPNIKNVQNLSLLEVAKELNRLIDAAREGKMSNADMQGGTISISNVGAIGGITATPVINKPDVAIVALGKTQQLPRFDETGKVYASNIMMVNWSGDHRVIDGATMVKFNNLWMDYLCYPEKMLVHLR